MTFPLFCGLHLVYGALTAFASERRMRGEGEVVGLPLVATLTPVALISAPLGAVLARFAGGWFFQGLDVEAYAIEYERFHLGVLILVGVAAAMCTVFGNFAAIAFLSREARKVALFPIALGILIMCTTAAVDPLGIIEVGQGRSLLAHPVGLFSLAIPLCLFGAYLFVKTKLSSPPPAASM